MVETPIRSMTGFGEGERELSFGRLRVEIRTVNHRYLKLQIRLPNGSERLQPALESRVRERLSRGHVSMTISVEPLTEEDDGSVPVDLLRARGYRDALRRLQEELGLGGSVDISLVAAFRDVFRAPDRDSSRIELAEQDVTPALDVALEQLVSMREEEGRRLARDLSGRLEVLQSELTQVKERAPHRLTEERDRLRQAIRELLDDGIGVDEERIAREIAHLAERWDIHEEVVRLTSHLQMFRETMEVGSEDGVGKRFGFIAQEILREVNTIGSKANDAVVAAHVVTMKEEVERLREQLENVE
jgi:uncharacterized protein (TIGR00255 family)